MPAVAEQIGRTGRRNSEPEQPIHGHVDGIALIEMIALKVPRPLVTGASYRWLSLVMNMNRPNTDTPIADSVTGSQGLSDQEVVGTQIDSRSELDFRGLLAELRGQLVLIVVLALVGACAAYGCSYLFVPQYEAKAVLMPVDEGGFMGGVGSANPALAGVMSAAGLGIQSKSREREALAVLQSRVFAMEFISQRANALQVMFPELWDDATGQWRTATGMPPAANGAFGRFDGKVRKVKRNTEAGLIELTVRLADRNVAAAWCNELAVQLNETLRRRAVSEAQKSLEFLDRELQATVLVETRQAIYALIEAQTKEIMLANVREEFAMRFIDPGTVPEPDAQVFPQRVVMGILGGLAGALLGALITVVRRRARKARIS